MPASSACKCYHVHRTRGLVPVAAHVDLFDDIGNLLLLQLHNAADQQQVEAATDTLAQRRRCSRWLLFLGTPIMRAVPSQQDWSNSSSICSSATGIHEAAPAG